MYMNEFEMHLLFRERERAIIFEAELRRLLESAAETAMPVTDSGTLRSKMYSMKGIFKRYWSGGKTRLRQRQFQFFKSRKLQNKNTIVDRD